MVTKEQIRSDDDRVRQRQFDARILRFSISEVGSRHHIKCAVTLLIDLQNLVLQVALLIVGKGVCKDCRQDT